MAARRSVVAVAVVVVADAVAVVVVVPPVRRSQRCRSGSAALASARVSVCDSLASKSHRAPVLGLPALGGARPAKECECECFGAAAAGPAPQQAAGAARTATRHDARRSRRGGRRLLVNANATAASPRPVPLTKTTRLLTAATTTARHDDSGALRDGAGGADDDEKCLRAHREGRPSCEHSAAAAADSELAPPSRRRGPGPGQRQRPQASPASFWCVRPCPARPRKAPSGSSVVRSPDECLTIPTTTMRLIRLMYPMCLVPDAGSAPARGPSIADASCRLSPVAPSRSSATATWAGHRSLW